MRMAVFMLKFASMLSKAKKTCEQSIFLRLYSYEI